jgi:ligand-binding SRPBCC domain-containing protein
MRTDRDEGYFFQQKTLIEKSLDEVFEFFSKAENLEVLTPSHLHFRILTNLPIEMKKGTLINYRIKLLGVPFKWRTKISEWHPPHKFVDIQLKGPYRQWIHIHTFEETEHGVLMTDMVHYKLFGFLPKNMLNKWFVKPQINKIFEYRRQELNTIFHTTHIK